ncbi:thrombospondin type 3 repeat-containing protein [Candidatus Gracilibacteria bacterium]|nr:thrombospondin type 3 repeat-containing protein [Candidatus Gracilibacteria bacterium]MCF7819805.1 thrombospondin type 3 repeat-containing protein [Candidatus Gracilibacteria bacterium]
MHKYLPVSFLLLFSGISPVFAGVPQVSEFPYEKKVIFSRVSSPTEVSVELDETTLSKINQDFSNIDLFNERNEEIDFRVYYDEFGRIKNSDIEVFETSSQRDDPLEYIADDDPLTDFSFYEREDGRDASWVLLDLKKPYQLVRAKIFPADRTDIRFVEILGGQEKDKLRTLVSKRPFNWQQDFNTPFPVRYVRISLWGLGITVSDIKLYKSDSATLYFQAQPGEQYRLLYGGPAVDLIRYNERLGDPDKGQFLSGQLTREKENDLFPVDFDGDGYDNANDNCPFISNPLQRDKDGDRIGDDCDNAPEVKNSNQYDTDYDGIGDIIDNCKLIPNPDQADMDDDGYGNACDSAHAEESDVEDSLINVTVGIVIGLVLILAFAFWKAGLWKKISKIKK